MSHNQLKTLVLISSATLITLIILCLCWEIFLAPLHSSSLLFLKTLPLLAPLFGILRGKRYTYQWSAMLILIYFCEGVVRAWSDRGLSQQLAGLEVVLSLIFFSATILYAKFTSRH